MYKNQNKSNLLRFLQLRERVGGLKDPTLWRWERDGLFPKRIKIGKRAVAWVESEIEEWLNSRMIARHK